MTLTVGFVTSVGRDILPGTSRRFAERRPAARLEMRQIGWHDPTAGLASGDTDLDVVWLPLPDDEILASEPLRNGCDLRGGSRGRRDRSGGRWQRRALQTQGSCLPAGLGPRPRDPRDRL
ncbi:MAG: LysR substrate-binding domain-containing protein [Solirubrobacterales bacterium]